jgi:uncharacterized OB-fold protein
LDTVEVRSTMPDSPVPAPHSIEEYRKGYEEQGRLRGFRSGCGFTTATWGLACPACGERDLAEVELTPIGRVVAFSVQTVPSDEFLNDAPYAYVVVELDGGGRVTGWMPTVKDEGALSIGDRVRLVAGYRPGVQFEKIADGAT